jgi:hypothetical protein
MRVGSLLLLLTLSWSAVNGQVLFDSALLLEAEDFTPTGAGWRRAQWGENYYAATLANSFLSRKAYLTAAPTCPSATATLTVQVPTAGTYLALVRYEAPHRFDAQFRLTIVQAGQTQLDRVYGARANPKIWAFGQKIQPTVAWDWGAAENVVWEGHDARVALTAGAATLTLHTLDQPADHAGARNVDCVLLTRDAADVQQRIAKEKYLPLDGLLTQAGDLYVRVVNPGQKPATLTVPNGTEHSPYWVHQRTWKPKTIPAAAGLSSDWIEVGSLLDTLNDGQWTLNLTGTAHVVFGQRNSEGTIVPLREFKDATGKLELAYDADVRTTKRIRTCTDVLREYVEYLRAQPHPGPGPKQTLIYGYTFEAKPHLPDYEALRAEFLRLMDLSALGLGGSDEIPPSGLVRGYIDVRGKPPAELAKLVAKLQSEQRADKIAVVSLGDEIPLPAPKANDHAGFRKWLQDQQLQPSAVDPAAQTWDAVTFAPQRDPAKPERFYYSRLYAIRHGIGQLKQLTDVLATGLPNAGIGANFSPHHGHPYLGSTAQFVELFRAGGLTMPWGEDYIWQVPVGTQQMNHLQLDMFRSGIRPHAKAKMHFYVMPHWPGNTPNSWRRLFFGALGHGVQQVNLFEFRPVQAAYTENHVSLPAMYQTVRTAAAELAKFEDIVQTGRVAPGSAALWCSLASEVWDDQAGSFGADKRCVYILARHAQLPLDVVIEGDDLAAYRVLFLTDRHVSRAASTRIAHWVQAGGTLIASAGAGLFDEFDRPNITLRELIGWTGELELSAAPIKLEKQDLPFATPLGTLQWPAYGAKAGLKGAETTGIRQTQVGQGRVLAFTGLPGLAYFQPALPRRPVDRGTLDTSSAHLLPTQFNAGLRTLITEATAGTPRRVYSSDPLIEATLLQAPTGVAVPVINWRGTPVQNVVVTIQAPGRQVTRASGLPVEVLPGEPGSLVCRFALEVADALIVR